MKRCGLVLIFVLCALLILPAGAQTGVSFSGQLNVFSLSSETFVREAGQTGDLSSLGRDEYLSFCLLVENNSGREFSWDSAYVRVDGGEEWHWLEGSLPANGSSLFHIYHVNMQKCLTPGEHTATWYFNGREVHTQRFLITQDMDWASVFPFPSAAQISNHNQTSTHRSPYLYGWMDIPQNTRYTEYAIDFKADYLPNGTYCCLGNWTMDYSSLNRRYVNVRTEYESVHAYAGFQSLYDGEKVGIMSFWDVYCTDASGNVTTIRAQRVYPATTSHSDDFGGEGTGAHCIEPYAWEADHWYRMHLKCTTSPTTGNTVVEQWVCDLETGVYTLICSYDTGVQNAVFKDSIALFLENFENGYSGEVRTLEVRNARYLDERTNQWKAIRQVYTASDSGLPNYEGSYRFGMSDNRLWMITSGVGGDWFNNGQGQQACYYQFD